MKRVILFLIITVVFVLSCGEKKNSSSFQNDPIQQKYLPWLTTGTAAIPQLKVAVKDSQWRIRTHALLAMGKTGDKSLIPIIYDILKKDKHRAVKNCAVIALGDLKAKDSINTIHSMLAKSIKQPGGVSPLILMEALGKIGSSDSIDSLYNVLFTNRNRMQLSAAKALIAINDKTVGDRILRDRARIKKNGIEKFAAQILGRLKVYKGGPYLLSILNGKNLRYKIAASVALGQINYKPASLSLVSSLKIKNKLLQKQASLALIAINDNRAVYPLIALFNDVDAAVYMSGAYVLSFMKQPGIAQRVYGAMKSNTKINRPAAFVLGRKKYKAAAPLIKSRLRDIKQSGHDELARSLGWLNDKSSIDLLIGVLKRKNLKGVAGSIWSLGQMKAGKAVDPMIAMIKSGDRRLRHHIIAALGSIGDQRAIEPLIELLYVSGAKYSRAVGSALGKIGGDKVKKFIDDNLDSGDPGRVMAAGTALLKIKDKSMVKTAVKLLDHDDQRARKYVMRYLGRITGQKFRKPGQWKQWIEKNPLY
jgi:HEAT repeat protein